MRLGPLSSACCALSLLACDPPVRSGTQDGAQPARGAASQATSPSPAAASEASEAKPFAPRQPPLAGDWLVDLPMPAGRRAVVTLPIGATTPRPVIVGVHGAGDRAEWACGGWRLVVQSYAFVVCPEGRPANGVFVTSDAKRLQEDIDAALVALRARYGPYVALGRAIYAGFSLGAIRAPQLLASSNQFTRAVLLEGGYESWSQATARAFRDRGGERALLVCAGKSCGAFAAAAGHLRGAGLEVEVRSAGTGKHNLDAEMITALREMWPFVVQGDPRWAGFAPAP